MPTDPDRLDAAIRAADPDDSDGMAKLSAALIDAELVVPVQPGSDGAVTLVTLLDGDVPYVPAYTTAEAASSQVPEGMPLQVVAVRALASQWPADTSLALNAGTEPSGWLAGEGVRALVDGPEVSVPAGTDVRIGEPEDEPVELLERAATWLAADGRAVAAYRALVALEGDEPGLVLGVVPADPEADPGPLLADLGRAIADLAPGSLDLLAVRSDQPDVIGAWMLESSTPFFDAPARPGRQRRWGRR